MIGLQLLSSWCGLPSFVVSVKEVIWSKSYSLIPRIVALLVVCCPWQCALGSKPSPVLFLSALLVLQNICFQYLFVILNAVWIVYDSCFLIIAGCQWNIVICCLLSFDKYKAKKSNVHWIAHLYVEYIMRESAVYFLDQLLHYSEVDLY